MGAMAFGALAIFRPRPDIKGMDTLFDNLRSIAPERLSFAPAFLGSAFLIERPTGNLLLYSSSRIADDFAGITARGGIARQYLNHQHQALASCDAVAAHFNAPLYCHADDAEAARQTCQVAATFRERAQHFTDFEVIPIPGHTPGSTAFRWSHGGRRYLFTGDTIYLSDGKWRIAVLPGISDKRAYAEALRLIRTLDFDVLVPNMAKGEPVQEVTAEEKNTKIHGLLAHLSAL